MSRADGDPDVAAFREYEDLWNGDYSKLDVVSDSVTVHDPAAPDGVVRGAEAFEEFLRGVREGFPDFHITTDDLLVDDDIMMLEWTATGTHTGTLEGLPPTGREFEVRGMSALVIEDGRVEEDRIYYDYDDFVGQLGLAFPAILGLLPKLVAGKVRELL